MYVPLSGKALQNYCKNWFTYHSTVTNKSINTLENVINIVLLHVQTILLRSSFVNTMENVVNIKSCYMLKQHFSKVPPLGQKIPPPLPSPISQFQN
jgi:hypothetical protein